jgi:Domain of unknown function (DUF4188)
MARVRRQTVDLSSYPDLVVINLGMRANSLRGLRTLISYGPRINRAAAAKPDGLLYHQAFFFSLLPPHAGIRQYWRDFESLERWTRADPHHAWWRSLLRDAGGTSFWHEAYFMRGGMEAIYLDLDPAAGHTPGLLAFAPSHEAHGQMFSARRRLHVSGEETSPPAVTEDAFYGQG